MKKLLLLLPLLLTGCSAKQITYTFDVLDHVTASITSEVQEKTHEPYLAYCKSGINYCFIEVPYGDIRTKLELIHTGYVITYDKTLSNNGWALV